MKLNRSPCTRLPLAYCTDTHLNVVHDQGNCHFGADTALTQKSIAPHDLPQQTMGIAAPGDTNESISSFLHHSQDHQPRFFTVLPNIMQTTSDVLVGTVNNANLEHELPQITLHTCDNMEQSQIKHRSCDTISTGANTHHQHPAQNLRTAVEVRMESAQLLQGLTWPERMPMGPCRTREILVQHLEKWASDPTTAGGAFSLSKDSLKPATSRRGSYQLIRCHRGGKSRAKVKNPTEVRRETQKPSAKVECPWGIYVESTDIGWIVTKPSQPALTFARNSGCQTETPAAYVPTPQLSAKATTTCGDRQTALLSSFRPLAEFAAKSTATTNKLHAVIKDLLVQFANDNKMGCDEGLKSADTVNLIGNPPGMKNQNQRRIQPHASGAPTTKRSHAASRANQKEKKAAAKALVAKALGRA